MKVKGHQADIDNNGEWVCKQREGKCDEGQRLHEQITMFVKFHLPLNPLCKRDSILLSPATQSVDQVLFALWYSIVLKVNLN